MFELVYSFNEEEYPHVLTLVHMKTLEKTMEFILASTVEKVTAMAKVVNILSDFGYNVKVNYIIKGMNFQFKSKDDALKIKLLIDDLQVNW